MEKILVFDTTLRDGEQSPGCSLRPAQKLLEAGRIFDPLLDRILPFLCIGPFRPPFQPLCLLHGIQKLTQPLEAPVRLAVHRTRMRDPRPIIKSAHGREPASSPS